ncbi:c-type cytochrome [Roseobacter sp.]|uniref:c-type cytochrome n=1 Tax=Roseobacter sp. TaxID=1907202 RepID=UPI00385A513C
MRFVTLPGMVCALAFGTLAACTEPTGPAQTMPTTADGAVFFAENCASCHGADGSGGNAKGLANTPPDLTMLSDRNGGTFPAARALSYIYGDLQTSHLARVMPEFGAEMTEDLVPVEIDGVLTPTPRELAGLLAFLENIQR